MIIKYGFAEEKFAHIHVRFTQPSDITHIRSFSNVTKKCESDTDRIDESAGLNYSLHKTSDFIHPFIQPAQLLYAVTSQNYIIVDTSMTCVRDN